MATSELNIAMALVEATEAASLGAAPWMGRGQKNSADVLQLTPCVKS